MKRTESTSAEGAAFAARRAAEDRARLSAMLVDAGQGNKTAFENLYRKTSAKLFGVCLRMFKDRAEAEDALQDAYVTIWNRASHFDATRASPITWLVTVTRNRAIDRIRSRGKATLVDVEQAGDVADPSPLAEARLLMADEDKALNGCIETLEGNDAAFIRAAFMQGATYAELAERDALPLGTVKSRIRRALIKLRACLEG